MHRSPCLSHVWIGCILAVLAVLSLSGAVRAEPTKDVRIALVIGNSAYAVGASPTSLKDAGLVARTLSQAGFAVTAAGDVDHGRLESILDGFLAEAANAGPDATIVVYLAGFGLQEAGSVYFVPIGATLSRDTDIPAETVSVTAFMLRLESLPAKARIFIYDLARETPFVMAGAPIASGLPLFQPATGTFVALNAAPGTVALPDIAPYGIYARALSEAIATSGGSMSALFERVRLRIGMLSDGANIPWNDGAIAGDISIGILGAEPSPRPSGDVKPQASPADLAYVAALSRDRLDLYAAFLATYPNDASAPRVRTILAVRREALIWNETLRVGTDRAYWTYMRRYRRGPHFADARRRLAMAQAALEPPPRFDILPYESAPLPQPWEAALLDRPIIVLDDPAWRPSPVTDIGLPPSAPAFYEDLPPPPLAPGGAVPIADPIGRHDGPSITQPDVPSIGTIVCETAFDPGGAWIASSLVDGKILFTTRASKGSKGDLTILQTGADGTVLSRTIVEKDKGTTTIVQTGPEGGILTKAVTRGEAAGGRSTLQTNGGNQLVAAVHIDGRGLTTVVRGPGLPRDQILAFPAKTGDRPKVEPVDATAAPPPVARPASSVVPQPPLPLAMPASALPEPVAPQPMPVPSAPPKTASPSTSPKTASPSTSPKTASPSTSPKTASPSRTLSPAAGVSVEPMAKPSAELPKIAPLPPRRAKSVKAPSRPLPASSRKVAPSSRRAR